jgi:hypothetical protein
VVSLVKLIKNDADMEAAKLLLTPYEIEDLFALPPGVSDSVVAAYRKAFDAAIKDPGYIAAANRINQFVQPRPGSDAEPLIAEMAGTPMSVRQRVMRLTSAH